MFTITPIYCFGSLFLAVFAVLPLFSPAVFRCYFATEVFKKSGFLRPGAVMPLYFSGIISGISERPPPEIGPLAVMHCLAR